MRNRVYERKQIPAAKASMEIDRYTSKGVDKSLSLSTAASRVADRYSSRK